MDAGEQWRQMEELFYAALDLDAAARPAFLQQACGSNTQLREEIESLLASSEKPMDFVPRAVAEMAHEFSAEDGLAAGAAAAQPARNRNRIAPGTQLSHYKIISMLGSGGMGEVYLAEDLRLRRRVALKMLAPELTGDERGLRRFEQEALAASALNHPNILTIHEFGQADGLHFIAAEFVEGETLRQKTAHGRLGLDASVDIGIQIASALVAAHACGIVHRDIKPENVIVRTDGIVKVLDFGIAKLTSSRVEQAIRRHALTVALSTTEPGMVRGTAKYMSPEQARGTALDARSDIFSLGSVMYELVTGKAAFDGETTSDVIAEILKGEPKPPVEFAPDVPPEIERILGKALRKDRESRYQSVAELLSDLREFKKEAEFQAKLQRPSRNELKRAGSDRTTPARAVAGSSDQIGFTQTWLWKIAVVLVGLFVIGYFVSEEIPTLRPCEGAAEFGYPSVSQSQRRPTNRFPRLLAGGRDHH